MESSGLRYGENPHQKGTYFGRLEDVFEKLNGKELSYNNLLDIDAAVNLIGEFTEPTIAILKHNNACGCATRADLTDAWKAALAGDPVSAFGGVIISNKTITKEVAAEMNTLFFEVIIAPSYNDDALEVLKEKKNRIILKQKPFVQQSKQFRTVLGGVLEQDRDYKTERIDDMKVVTKKEPSEEELNNLSFAMKICKHSKSNTIVLAKNMQLIGSGVGMTSRVDALKHAINKAKEFKHEIKGAVMASDAFFPFSDCVEIANNEGIKTVIQPGGSIKDQDSVDFCNTNNMTMVMTGIRHFKH
jgi:phosphoribosylaminoimidazolecarboxamide formyltransferase/IMP cyclohydrolase